MLTAVPKSKGRLLIIAEHRPSTLLSKGEYTARYYNPSNVFEEVHLLLLNDDRVDTTLLQPAVGDARLHVHNLPPPGFVASFGWQRWLISGWASDSFLLVKKIQPNLIRVHNNFLAGYLTEQIKEKLEIPYALSIHHQHWERLKDNQAKTWLVRQLLKKFEKSSLSRADAVIAIHEPVRAYAERMGAEYITLIYNVVSDQIKPKKTYRLSDPPRLICINQQIKHKNPANIIRAIVDIECELTLVGDGSEHENLVALVRQLGIRTKVKFVKATANAQLMEMLPDFDMLVSHCGYWGISKSTIEGALAGMPIILNQHEDQEILEFEGNWLRLVKNTPEGYRLAILELLENLELRRDYGKRARDHAQEYFDPQEMEKKLANLYRSLRLENA